MRKWIALLLALTMLCLCGCDTNDNTPTPTVPAQTDAPEPSTEPDLQLVDLTLRVAEEGMWADAQAVEALLAEFNAYYPNIIIHVEYGSVAMLDGENPDIVLANIDQFALGDRALLLQMEDLSDLWSGSLQGDVYEAVETACEHSQGGFYAVPLAIDPYCMAVNQTLFEEAEALSYLNTVNHTWNTTSFLKAVQAVYDNGMDTVGTIYCKGSSGDNLTRLLVTNLYDGSFLEKNGTYNVVEGDMAKALSALAQQDGIRFDGNVGAEGARTDFLAGETAFLLNWSASDQLANSHSDILFMNYPSADSRPETWAEVYGFGIYNKGDPVKVAASRTFVTFMTNSSAAVRATGLLAARESLKDAYDGTDLERTAGELNKLVTYLTEAESTGEHWETARNLWQNMLRRLGTDRENWQSVLEETQRELNSLFPELFPPETEATTAPTE